MDIEIDGKKEKVDCMSDASGVWFHFRGETYFYEFKKSSAKARKSAEAKGGNILAPMPGKITKVLVSAGSEVIPKQTLVMMEAMKMEYNLRAEVAGKVKAVTCKEGEQVVQDQLLVEFEESK